MLKDKRKIKKFQKLSAWILFVSMMGFLFIAAALSWLDEEGTLSGIIWILFFLLLLVAVLDMFSVFFVQVILDIREKGIKEIFLDWLKSLFVCLMVGIVVVMGHALWKKTGFHIKMVKDILRFLVIAWLGNYVGGFWSRKLLEE